MIFGPIGSHPVCSLPLAGTALVDLTGAVSPVGDLNVSTVAVLLAVVSGQLSPSGALRRLTAKAMTGATTPAGVLVSVRLVADLLFTGLIAPSGDSRRAARKALGGVLFPLGGMVRRKLRRPLKMIESIGFLFRG